MPPPRNAIEDNTFQLFYITSAHPFNRCLFVSPPTSPPIGPFAGKSTSGGLPAFGPKRLSFGLFIVGGLYCPLFIPAGLGLPGAPILLVASSWGFTILVVLGPGGAVIVAWVEPGTCLRSLVRGLEDLWSIPGVLRMDGDSA
jgi:hypothetical protein